MKLSKKNFKQWILKIIVIIIVITMILAGFVSILWK